MWELAGAGEPSASPIDEFWSARLVDTGQDYTSPSRVLGYRAGEVPGTACADRLPADSWVGNAYYCDLDSTIAYDLDFLRGLTERNGEHAGLAVLAHEWAHHVQHLRGTGSYTIQRELQADCLAAVYLGHLELVGDVDAIDATMQSFYRLGDSAYADATWFAAGEHGSPNQRFAAAALGFLAVQGGLGYCDGYSAWSPGQRVTFGASSLAELPGHQGEVASDGRYVVPEGHLPAFSIERVALQWRPGAPDAAAIAWLQDQELVTFSGPHPQPPHFAISYVERVGSGSQLLQEVVGVYAHPDDPGHALLLRVELPASLSEEEAFEASIVAAQVASLLGARICGPGEQASAPDAPGFHYVCDPDL